MRNYTTQTRDEITAKINAISGMREEAFDYFTFVSGSGITDGLQCGGYYEHRSRRHLRWL